MPSKQLIHAQEDIESILHFADSVALSVLPDTLEEQNGRPRTPDELRSFSCGTIYLFRPEWVMDGIPLRLIDGGPRMGKYDVPPGVNFSPIKLYFSGELDVAGVHRLGDGVISFKREWLHAKSHEMRPTPPEVEVVYKQVCKHLLSGVVARGGGHVYHVCKEAAELARRIETRPPFDYIEWPPSDLHKKSKR